mgnify:CR=1 FL=1
MLFRSESLTLKLVQLVSMCHKAQPLGFRAFVGAFLKLFLTLLQPERAEGDDMRQAFSPFQANGSLTFERLTVAAFDFVSAVLQAHCDPEAGPPKDAKAEQAVNGAKSALSPTVRPRVLLLSSSCCLCG